MMYSYIGNQFNSITARFYYGYNYSKFELGNSRFGLRAPRADLLIGLLIGSGQVLGKRFEASSSSTCITLGDC